MLRRRFKLPVHRHDRTKTPRHDSQKRNHKEDPSHFRFQALIDRSIRRTKRCQRRPDRSKSPDPVDLGITSDNEPTSKSFTTPPQKSSRHQPTTQTHEHSLVEDHPKTSRTPAEPLASAQAERTAHRASSQPSVPNSPGRSKVEPSENNHSNEDGHPESKPGDAKDNQEESDGNENVTSHSVDEDESGVDLEFTDSDSAPTQIIALSALASDTAESVFVGSRPGVQEDLHDMYGSTYHATDDIAGLFPPQDIDSSFYKSSKDMSAYLEVMKRRGELGDFASLDESITTQLLPPYSYTEALLDAISSMNEHLLLSKIIVGAWIIFSLALSRVDGLILTNAIHSIFQLDGINDVPLFLSDLSALVKQCWFSDGSMLQSDSPGTGPLVRRSVVSTRPISKDTSCIQAIVSGRDRGQGQHQLRSNESVSTRSRSAVLLRPKIRDQSLTDHASKLTKDEHENQASTPRAKRVLDAPRSSRLKSHGKTKSTEELGHLIQTSNTETNVVTGIHLTGDTMFTQHSIQQLDKLQSEQDSSKRRLSDPVESLQLDCKHPSCERSFVSESEYGNHIRVWHRPPSNSNESEHSNPQSNILQLADSITNDLSSTSVDFRTCTDEEAHKFFVPGRVFATMWHGSLHSRRFVVILRRQGYCSALPIFSYGGRGLRQGDIPENERQRFTIIHDSSKDPQTVPGEGSFEKQPIPIELEVGQTLEIDSRLCFDRPHDIDWQSKVSNIGKVHGIQSLRNLKSYFKTEFLRDEEEPSP